MASSGETIRRLVLIRLLLARAEEDSHLSPPFSTDSVNRLHDVAEMFLALAAQENHVEIPPDFIGYWQVLEKPLGRPLAYRAQMQKLNKVRVSLKHYGVEPTEREIQASAAAVRGLLEDESSDLLGVGLDDVTLYDVVKLAEARDLLKSAEQHSVAGEETESFADLADAFDTIIRDYAGRKQVWHGRSVFESTKDLTFLSPFFRGVDDREESQFDEAVIDSLKALDFKVMIIGLGVDLRRYGKFEALTPLITRTMDGTRHVSERPGIHRDQADYEFCKEFVVSTSVHLDQFDYDFDLWTSYQEAIGRERDRSSEVGDDKDSDSS